MLCAWTVKKESAVAHEERRLMPILVKDKTPKLVVEKRSIMQPKAPVMVPAANVRSMSCEVHIKGEVVEGISETGLAIVLASHCVARTLEIEGADEVLAEEVVAPLGLKDGNGGGMKKIESERAMYPTQTSHALA